MEYACVEGAVRVGAAPGNFVLVGTGPLSWVSVLTGGFVFCAKGRCFGSLGCLLRQFVSVGVGSRALVLMGEYARVRFRAVRAFRDVGGVVGQRVTGRRPSRAPVKIKGDVRFVLLCCPYKEDVCRLIVKF